MTILWIGVALLVVAAVTFVFFRKPAARPVVPAARPIARSAADPIARPAAGAASNASAAPTAADETMPPALAGFELVRAADLSDERRCSYAETFHDIPRPPKLMHHLLSPDFVNTASSAQLVDLITGEPLIAAKVLAAVNSPMYGLKSPVGSIGQAVTYLGLNTVRSVCLQYILIASFTADSADRKHRLETAWTASALASELTQQLSQRLELADRGSLVSAVVLSFLGRLATTATLSAEQLAALPRHGLLGRTAYEQRTLGLSASQIGSVLMADWGLPAKVVEDASGIDTVLVTPASGHPLERGDRLAICYLCARIGERLAEGTLPDLGSFPSSLDGDAELHHLRSYLVRPLVSRALQLVHAPDVVAAMQQMQAATRA